MTKRKELSIVAIVIDNLEITKRFVSSIRQYTNTEYELILIDNASTSTEAKRFIKNISDKSFRFKKRVSVSKAWNKGVECSKGTYIVIANNDTIVCKDWFKQLKKPFLKDKKCGIVSPLTFWNYSFNLENKRMKPIRRFLGSGKAPFFRLKKFNQGIWGEFLLFKRKDLIKLKMFSTIYPIASGEDLDMLFTYYKAGFNAYINPNVFIYHEGNASHRFVKGNKNKLWDHNYYKIFVPKWRRYSKDI